MSTISLTPTSYLVLGCIADGGPSTPYELKQAVTIGVGYFWAFPHSQLYSEPVRLADAGLLKETREAGGRRRRVFAITEAGQTALRDWLGSPESELPDIRDIGLLKLFFADHASVDQIRTLAESQCAAHRQQLELYESLDAASIPGSAGVALGLGLAWERAASDFWHSVAKQHPTS